jgi:NDP-sugar pyrophosphorylase family protein
LEDEFLVLYGDSYLPTDYAAIVRAFRESGCPALMSVYRNQGRWDRSNVRVADGRVVFYSKSAEAAEVDCIDYGLSAYRRHVLEALRGTPLPLDLAALQRDLVARGEMAAHVVPDRFYEIGKPEGLAEVDRLLSVAGVAP